MKVRWPVQVGVIGYGYWGPNLVRNFVETPHARVVAVADLSPERLRQVQIRHPEIAITQSARDLICNPEIDAVAIATPPASHFELASMALDAGKHVMVEKPLCTSSRQALTLVRKAERRRRTLLVDHTFVYTGAVRKLQELVVSGALGDIFYYDSVRVNLGLFQSDLSVLWDLAVHDLSIIDVLMPARPTGVSAYGVRHVPGQPENIAYVILTFPGRQLAHLHVNWLAPVKIRRTLLGCRDKMVVYDDVEPSEKLKIYDKGAFVTENPDLRYKLQVSYRHGDVWAPKLPGAEALQIEIHHFLDCIRTNMRPKTDGWSGLRVVRILEAAEQSMRAGGQFVRLDLEEQAA